MRAFGSLLLLAVAASVLAPLVSPQRARAQDGDDPPPAEPGAKDASTPAFLKALDLQRKGKWKEAQAAFRDLLKKWPESVHKEDCDIRGGDNAYLGTTKLLESGPPGRRIDVAFMGDGFQIDDKAQAMGFEWGKNCLDVLFTDDAYDEYRNYFNYYYVRLASKDAGVDKKETEAERIAREEKNKRKSGKNKKSAPQDFNTALDCKAAGPQGQVISDRDLVYHWLKIANDDVRGVGDDALVIVFAKFGVLGMGGGGIANVGNPEAGATIHEFGHAFVGLLDEYQNNPSPPGYAIRAPNATSDPKFIPWQHFLDKKVPGVGVFEGGATHVKGVWRPAQSGCAMNTASRSKYCPVCREAAVLRIYAYCSPIDTVRPAVDTETRCVEGDGTTITLVPMRPKSHDLKVEWYFERVADSEPGPVAAKSGDTSDRPAELDGFDGGARGLNRETALFEIPPMGVPADDLAKAEKDAGRIVKWTFDASKLPRGRWIVTAAVSDPTEWVLKDKQHLTEERATWWFHVQPKGK